MTDGEIIRILEFRRRIGGVSSNGCTLSVKYIVENEPGVKTDWLDEFIVEHCDNVVLSQE